MNLNEKKLAKKFEENEFISNIKLLDTDDQLILINEKIKKINKSIKEIRDDNSSYISLADAKNPQNKKRTLKLNAKTVINVLEKEKELLAKYSTYIKKKVKNNVLNNSQIEEDKIILNKKQLETLKELLEKKSLENSNPLDVAVIWKYLIMEKSIDEFDEYLYLIVKYITDYNINCDFSLDENLIIKLGEVKNVATRQAKKYIKKSHERKILNSNKKFIKSVIKLNTKTKEKDYDYRYEILEYFMNDEDCFIYLKRIFSYDETLFNLRDKNKIHVFNNILAKYVEAYKRELKNHEKDYIHKEYYEQLIKLFVKNGVYKLDEIDQKITNSILNDFEIYLKNSSFKRESVLNALDAIKNIFNIDDKINYQKEINAEEQNNELIMQINNLYQIQKIEIDNDDRKKYGDDLYTFMIETDNPESNFAYTIELTEKGHIWLSIHTVDVACLIAEDSILDKVLYNKMFSINECFEKQTLDNLLLTTEDYRPCLTYRIELLGNGRVGNFKFLKSNVKLTEKISKQEFNANSRDAKYNPFIQASYLINPQDNYPDVATRIEKTYTKLVNNVVGKYFQDNKLPFLYRNHLEQDSQKFAKIISNLNYIFSKISEDNFKIMYKSICDDINKAYYDTKNLGHSGLELKYSSDIMLPFNSYLGIVAQRLVLDFVISKVNNIDRLNAVADINYIKYYANEVKQQQIEKKKIMRKNN